jgi:subtilisin family serine protease
MKKFWVLALFLAAATAASFMIGPVKTAGQKNKFRRSVERIPGSYIVVLDEKAVGENLTSGGVAGEANFLTGTYGGEAVDVYSSAVKGFSARMTEAQAEDLSEDPRVAYIEEDAVVRGAATQNGAPWHLDRVDQRALPMDSTFNYASDGTGVHAYIFDSGIRVSHSEFGGRASVAVDYMSDGRNGDDCNGHGTHVAGLVGGATYGVAKNVRLHALRVLGCDNAGSVAKIVAATDWVTANRDNPAVVNISITAAGTSSIMETAIDNSVASGVTYVVAAGNNAWNACDYTPARTPSAITVGATSETDIRPNYSNYGPCLDLFAPGYMMTSAGIANDTDVRVMSGTSMASPLVAGAAAIYLSANPGSNPAAVTQAILNNSTTGLVTNIDSTSPNRLLNTIWGSLPSPTPSPTPIPSPTATPSPSPTPTPGPASAARVTVKKRVQNNNGGSTSSTVPFPYAATNLSTPTFSLAADQQYDDPNVQVAGTQTVVNVTEASMTGYRLVAIDCVEVSTGLPTVQNTTVDLANRKAIITAEPGESITCTFTSNQLAPTSATADVTGRVVTAFGRGIGGVMLAMTNMQTGQTTYASTSSFGYYGFTGVATGQTYVVTVMRAKRYHIEEGTRLITVFDNLTGIDFIGASRY